MKWLSQKHKPRPLLKKEIEDAQSKTKSGAEASRYLGVSYNTYTKYAKLYGIHEKHLNQSGIGIPKFRIHDATYPLKDILDGKHPTYGIKKLKKRLIKAGYFEEKCQLCGFDEKRVTDFKSPLMLTFVDGNSANHKLENMKLLCYNCCFLTVGELNNINSNRFNKLAAIDQEPAPDTDNEVGLSVEEIESTIREVREELQQ